MEKFEKQKTVKRMLVDYVPKPTKSAVSKAFSKLKNSIQNLHYGAEKGAKEKEVKKENQEQTEDEANLAPLEHERALERACKCSVLPGLSLADIDGQALIESQLKEMQPTKVIIMLWVR